MKNWLSFSRFLNRNTISESTNNVIPELSSPSISVEVSFQPCLLIYYRLINLIFLTSFNTEIGLKITPGGWNYYYWCIWFIWFLRKSLRGLETMSNPQKQLCRMWEWCEPVHIYFYYRKTWYGVPVDKLLERLMEKIGEIVYMGWHSSVTAVVWQLD